MAKKKSAPARLVYYAINDNPMYLAYVEKSLHGLRRFNVDIPVKVAVFGKVPRSAGRRLLALGAEVVPMPAVKKEEEFTFLKWFALPEVAGEHDLLFLDADTLVFDDVAKLFSRYRDADFAARREVATRPGMRAKMMVGGYVVIPAIETTVFRRIRKKLKLKERPVFNTGVMLFSARGQAAILKRFGLFKSFKRDIVTDRMEYPCNTVHILEEIVFTMVLGRVTGIKLVEMRMRDSPWYVEWKGKYAKTPGIVLHTWSHYYLFGLLDLYGMKAFRKPPFRGLVHPKYLP